MKQPFLALALCALAHAATGADVRPLDAWAPPGWRTIAEADGDLDRDGVADAVRVYEAQDPAKIRENDGLGFDEINTNPRKLVVLLAQSGGYRLAGGSDTFLPTQGSEESPCLEDPLSGVDIARGLLKITLSHWMSCGGWGTSRHVYTFRHEHGRMRLIGEDDSHYMRNTGEMEEVSTNHLTGKRKTTKGLNAFDGAESRPVVTWDRVDGEPRWLEQMQNPY